MVFKDVMRMVGSQIESSFQRFYTRHIEYIISFSVISVSVVVLFTNMGWSFLFCFLVAVWGEFPLGERYDRIKI